MSYRNSPYDPLPQEMPGRPLRPFNAFQWLGVAMAVVGGVLGLSYLAARLGWTSSLVDSPAIGFWLAIIGSLLVTSRREPGRLITEAERRRTAHWLLGSFLVSVVVVLAVVLIIDAS